MLEDILQILLNHSKRHGNKPASFFIWKKAPSCKLNTVMPSTVSSSDARLPDQVFACLEPNEEPRLSAVGSTAAGMLQPCFQEAGGFTGGGLSSFCACLWQPGGEQTPTPPPDLPTRPSAPSKAFELEVLSLSLLCVPKPVSCKVHRHLQLASHRLGAFPTLLLWSQSVPQAVGDGLHKPW